MRIPQSVLKYIAYITMLIDHLAILLDRHLLIDENTYWIMRGIGRLAFPLFLFFLVRGSKYTTSLPKYLTRIGALAIVSEIPYDLYFYGGFPNWEHQNIFFELFLCLVLIALFERFLPCNRESCKISPEGEPDFCPAYIAFLTAIMCIPAYFLHFSYGLKGILATAFLYKYNQEREETSHYKGLALQIFYLVLAALSLCIRAGNIQYAGLGVVPLILLCDNEYRKQSKVFQWAFYLFYPVHIFVLYMMDKTLQ